MLLRVRESNLYLYLVCLTNVSDVDSDVYLRSIRGSSSCDVSCNLPNCCFQCACGL